ncbi:MAG TPA: glycoside hydrolase N-terminal domain-containing protein, partial [Paludibacter sp.]
MTKSRILLLLAICSLASLSAQSNDCKLWYDKPAQVWTEALPLGNGRLGAMVFGNPASEQ